MAVLFSFLSKNRQARVLSVIIDLMSNAAMNFDGEIRRVQSPQPIEMEDDK